MTNVCRLAGALLMLTPAGLWAQTLDLRFSNGTTYTPGAPLSVTATVDGVAVDNMDVHWSVPGPTIRRSRAVTWTPSPEEDRPVRVYASARVNGVLYKASAVLVSSATCNLPLPVITSVNSASDFGGMSSFASGSWLEIKGTNLASNTRVWLQSDFNQAAAPTILDGTAANAGDKAAFIYFISPNQINVQAPADSTGGPEAITVTNCAGTSQPLFPLKTSVVPGILASSKFNVGGRQYAIATYPTTDPSVGPFVGSPNLIPPFLFVPAKPGDTVTLYGIGFGDVTPVFPPGVVVTASNKINAALAISLGSTLATLTYQGLAPNNIGLYQFNVTVPNVADGDYPINITVNNVPLTQPAFYLTVKR